MTYRVLAGLRDWGGRGGGGGGEGGGGIATTPWYEPNIDVTERFRYFYIRPLPLLWREILCWTLWLV